MNCLENLIKLSRTTCACFDENKPVDYNVGKSEIYLDELEGLNLDMINASANCEEGNLWDMMVKARTNATLQFKADLLGCVNMNYMSKRPNFNGLLGQVAFNQTLNYTENQAGISLKTYNVRGGKMTVKRIGLMFNTTQPFVISVYSNEDLSSPIAQYNVTSAANSLQYVTLATPLVLPLWSENETNLTYFFVYDLIGTYFPKNNKAQCNCGGTNAGNITYKNWLQLNGIKGNSPTLLTSFATTTELNGLVLDAEFTCDSSRLICSDEYPLDVENDGRGLQIAYTIRFKAGEILIDEILSSPEINRYTMMDREALYGKRNRYRKLYEDWVAYLCENTEVMNSDCLVCRPNNNFVKGSILV